MNDNIDTEKQRTVVNGSSGLRRLAIVAAGMGLGAVLAYLISKARGTREDRPRVRHVPEYIVDDRGTGQEKAAQILRNLRDRAFEASDERLALALGRPLEEIDAWNAGQASIDSDAIMKARGIAIHRGVRIE
jgi:hypothetical protein